MLNLVELDLKPKGGPMQKTEIILPEVKLLGIKTRTNNQNELNYELAKIYPTMQRYFNGQLSSKIPNSKKTGTTFCVYTDYAGDHTDDYSYFIGEEVHSFNIVPVGFECQIIPEQVYVKFTVSGSMPNAVVDAWHRIWLMSESRLGGERSYSADFEVYDERASNHQNIEMDIYIGINK